MTLCFLLSTAAFTTAFCFHSVYISEEITSIFKEISVRKSAWQKLCGSCVVTPAWWPPRALLLTGILFLPHGSAKGRQAEPSGGPRPFSPRVQTCQFEISKSFREIPSLDLNRHLQCFDFRTSVLWAFSLHFWTVSLSAAWLNASLLWKLWRGEEIVKETDRKP